jgi:hypothetical protein
VPPITAGLDPNLAPPTPNGGQGVVLRPFGGGYSPSDIEGINEIMARVAAENPGMGYPTQLPSPADQEQAARPLPLKLTHELLAGWDAINNALMIPADYATGQVNKLLGGPANPEVSGLTPGQLQQVQAHAPNITQPTTTQQVHEGDVQAQFERIYQEQGPLAAGQYLHQNLDPGSKFAYELLGNPTTWVGPGALDALGSHIIVNAGGDVTRLALGRALQMVDKVYSAPFDLGGWATGKAVDAMHLKPVFSWLTHAPDEVNQIGAGPLYPFMPGSSTRAKVTEWARSAHDLLDQLRQQGWDQTTFRDATGDPWQANPFPGFTAQARQGWDQGWTALRAQATRLENPLSQLYATRLVDEGRQATAFQTQRVAADVARIESGDPAVFAEYGRTPAEAPQLKGEIYDNLHSYVQSIQQAVADRIEAFQPNESLVNGFTAQQKADATQVLRELNNTLHNDVVLSRSNIDKVSGMVTRNQADRDSWVALREQARPEMERELQQGVINGPYTDLFKQIEQHLQTNYPVPSSLWQSQATQHFINARNLAMDQHYQAAYQRLADVLTGGDTQQLHGLIGVTDFENPVYRDLVKQVSSLRAQSLGQDAIAESLPPQLSQWYKQAGLDRDLPGFISRAVNDKQSVARVLATRDSNGISRADEVLGRLGMSPADIKAAKASGQSFQQTLASRGVTSLRDLVDRFRSGGVFSNDEWNRLNQLASKYERTGDLLNDDGLQIVGHLVVQKAFDRFGPSGMDKVFGRLPRILQLMGQSYKERMLLSAAYHPLVQAQELYAAALHGISPFELGGYLAKAGAEAATGHGPEPTLPKYIQRGLDLWGQDKPPLAVTTGGLANATLSKAGVGGPTEALTATEQLPGWAKTGTALLHAASMAVSTGNPMVGALNMVPHLLLEHRVIPALAHTNADVARALEVVLRSVPWYKAKSEYLQRVAPDFLDRLEGVLMEPRSSLSGELPAVTGPWLSPMGVPDAAERLPRAGIGNYYGYPQRTPGVGVGPLNNFNQVRDVVDRLRARGGFFSPDDVADVASLFNVPTAKVQELHREWLGLLYAGDRAGIDFASHIHFDAGRPSQFEDTLSGFFPFYMWMFRLLPFTAIHMIEQPALAEQFINAQKDIEQANRNAGRTQAEYNGMVQLPGTGGIASFINGHPGSPDLMVNPFSAIVPGMGAFTSPPTSSEPPINQLLGAASGIGLEPYPPVTLGLNAAAAALRAMGGPDVYDEPAGGFSRQASIYGLLNNALVDPAVLGLNSLLGPLGDQSLNYPLAQLRLQDADPDYWWKVLYNTPNVALGERPQSYQDIAVRKRLAEMSLEQYGRPNAPPMVQAMDQPNSPLYQMALAEVQRQQNLSGAMRFLEPFSLRVDNPTSQAINTQRSAAEMAYGPTVAQVLGRFLPSRYPLWGAYSAANNTPDGMYDFTNQSFPYGFTGSQLVPTDPRPLMEQYVEFASSYGIPPNQWWLPQNVTAWLESKAASERMGQLLEQRASQPINPNILRSPVP